MHSTINTHIPGNSNLLSTKKMKDMAKLKGRDDGSFDEIVKEIGEKTKDESERIRLLTETILMKFVLCCALVFNGKKGALERMKINQLQQADDKLGFNIPRKKSFFRRKKSLEMPSPREAVPGAVPKAFSSASPEAVEAMKKTLTNHKRRLENQNCSEKQKKHKDVLSPSKPRPPVPKFSKSLKGGCVNNKKSPEQHMAQQKDLTFLIDSFNKNESPWIDQLDFAIHRKQRVQGRQPMPTIKLPQMLLQDAQAEGEKDFSRSLKLEKTKERVNLRMVMNRKRCSESETIKKQKKSKNVLPPLEPSPKIPEAFQNHIKDIKGSEPTLVIQKELTDTDVNEGQGRFSIPKCQVRAEFLKEDEKKKLAGREAIDVTFIDPSLRETTLVLKKWRMSNTFSYVLISRWNDVKKRNEKELKVHAVVQLWSFRCDSRLCFALIVVPPAGGG